MKTQFLIAAVLIVVLGGVGGAYYYLAPPAPAQTGGEVQTPGDQRQTMTGLQIAERIYGYVESQRRADGLYDYATNCNETVCSFDFENPHDISNAWAAYASVGMYGATGDQRYLDAAKADGEKILQYCGSGREECVSIGYQIVALYEATGDSRYLDLAEAEAAILMEEGRGLYDSGSAMLVGGDSKGMAELARASGDAAYSQDASRILEGEVGALENEVPLYVRDEGGSARVYKSFACWPQLARLSLYQATGDRAHLDAAAAFAGDMDVPGHVGDLVSATDIQPCIELYHDLGSLTGEQAYGDGADVMVQHVLDGQWDYGASDSIRFYRDKSFSTLTDSSYMVNILSKRADSVYEVG